MNEKKQLGFYIQYYRKKLNKTQSEFADGFCVRQTLAKIENGEDSVDIKSYVEIIRRFDKQYLLDYDRDTIEGLIAELYYSVLQMDNQKVEANFIELRSQLTHEDALQEEYLLLLDTLMQHYVNHRKIDEHKLTEHLEKKGMYPTFLAHLLNDMAYQTVSKVLSIKKLARYCDKYSLFTPKEPLSARNGTISRIAQKRYLEAYDLCKDITEFCETHNCPNMQLESMRYALLLFDQVQPLYVDMQFKKVEEFLKQKKDQLPTKKISDVYYQMGVMNILNGNYEKAYPHFKNCHEVNPTLLSAIIFMNYISLRKKRINNYISLDFDESRYSPVYVEIYKYFDCKYNLLKNNENQISYYKKLESYLINNVLDYEIQDSPLAKIIREETFDVYNHTGNSKLQYSIS